MKYKGLSICLLFGIVLFVFLQSVYRFHFFHLEQYGLFLFDNSYIADTAMTVGGVSLLIYEFILQFFIYPYAGAAITSVLLTLVVLLTYAIVKKIDGRSGAFVFLSLLPAVSLLFMHYNFNYLMQGTAAYLLMLAAFYFYLYTTKLSYKLIYALAAVILLFWWGGSVALLFAVSVLLKELWDKPVRGFWFLIPCASSLLLAWGSVRWGMVGEYRFALLPDMYYHHVIRPADFSIYLSWLCFPAILVAVCALRKRKPFAGKALVASIVVQIALVAVIFWIGFDRYGDTRSLKFKEMEYYYRTGRWDKITEMNKGKISNYLYACMLNLSLAEKGELADKMFSYDQIGEQGLFVSWNKSHGISMLLSDINYTIGNTGAAQNMAFESNVSSLGKRTGRMIQRLVKTNLIYGEYKVAEKYIELLEKTLYYDDWAKEQRKYLNNDAEIEKNEEYAIRRKSLPEKDFMFSTDISDGDLLNLAEGNPENKIPIQYAGALYLLAKRLDFFGNLTKTYYGTPVLPALPVSFQEAVVILNEQHPETWSELGVSDDVIKRFGEYKKLILSGKNNSLLPDMVRNSYGDTYWYYYMFKK